jgi:CHAT domain-containing protein
MHNWHIGRHIMNRHWRQALTGLRLQHVTVCCIAMLLSIAIQAVAQDMRTDCHSAPGSYFISPEDSLGILAAFSVLDSLATLLREDMSPAALDRYRTACERQLSATQAALSDTLHPLYAEALAYTAEAYWLTDRNRSTPLYERAIAIMQRLPGNCRSAWAGRMYGNLAFQYYEENDLDASLRLYDRSIAILSSLPPPPAAFLATQYLFQGLAYRRALRNADAAHSFSRAAEWQMTAGDSTAAAEALSWYADALYRVHDFDGAERAYHEAYNIMRRAVGAYSEQAVSAIQDLATFFVVLGKYHEAYRVLSELLPVFDRPGAHYDAILVFFAYASLAQVSADLGNDAEAEALFNEAARRVERIPEKDRPMYKAMITNNSASFLASRQRYEEAATLVEEALRLMDRSEWDDVDHFKARAGSNLGSMYSALHRYTEAESLLLASVGTYEEVFGAESSELAAPLSNLGMLYRDLGRMDEARTHVTRALYISRASYGEEHPLSARLLRNLGSIEALDGNDSLALAILHEAERKLRRWYDTQHSEMLDCYRLLGGLYERHADNPNAARVMRQLIDGTIRRLRDSFDFESEQQQLRLYETLVERHIGIVGRWAMHEKAPGVAAELLLDASLQLKGEILAENVRLQRALQGRQQEADLAKALNDARERYAALATKSPSEDVLVLQRRLAASIDSLDAALRRNSSTYERSRRVHEAGWRDMQRLLQRDEALIEYFILPPSITGQPRNIVAVLLMPGGSPQLLSLCDEDELARAMRSPLDTRMMSLLPTDDRMRALASRIWNPLAHRLQNIRRVIIIPDGILHRVAFAALQPSTDDQNLSVLDSMLELRQFTSSKDLLTRSARYRMQRSGLSSGCILLGNPDFGIPHPASPSRTAAWSPLPGSKIEVERIAELCRRYTIDVKIVEGEAASEHFVKGLSGSQWRILHFATHGFFFPTPRQSHDNFPQGIEMRGREALRSGRHPLLRSGLILAGANTAWTGAPVSKAAQDGILTALEISRLDFSATELVVLSACETALGDITTGEGVFGLQRSFLFAGVSSLIMSLWQVPDQPTAELMALFYETWFSGTSKSDALRSARAELRRRYPDPRIWAPFILVGE